MKIASGHSSLDSHDRKRVTASEKKQRHVGGAADRCRNGSSRINCLYCRNMGVPAVETPVMSSLRPTKTGLIAVMDPRRSTM